MLGAIADFGVETGCGSTAWSVLTASKSARGRILNKGSRSTLRARRQIWEIKKDFICKRLSRHIKRLWGIGGRGRPVIWTMDLSVVHTKLLAWITDPCATRHLKARRHVKIFLDENNSQETAPFFKFTPDPYETTLNTLASTLSIDLAINIVDWRQRHLYRGICPKSISRGTR